MGRCLIIDDDPLCRAMLTNFFCARCDLAADGQQGLTLFEKSLSTGLTYDLICLDLAMPVMSGHMLIRRIRELSNDPSRAASVQSKIFVISASSSPWDMAEALLDNFADDYLIKPLHHEKLLALLEKHGLQSLLPCNKIRCG